MEIFNNAHLKVSQHIQGAREDTSSRSLEEYEIQ
jgi:hypothetical protein